MPAPKNNKNACKWTIEIVTGYLAKIEAAAMEPKTLFLGKELEALGLYRDIWCYWKRKYGHLETIIEQMELIEGMLESNLFHAAIRGRIRASVAIICLKHVYGWREEPDSDNGKINEIHRNHLRILHKCLKPPAEPLSQVA